MPALTDACTLSRIDESDSANACVSALRGVSRMGNRQGVTFP
jgi:hypothetical protein